MEKESKVFVAGSSGLVGSSLVRCLQAKHYENIVVRSSRELDLRSQAAVESFFASVRPDYVFLAAAKVGGILANSTQPAPFIYDNLMIAANVIEAARVYGVKKLLFLGSSCIYPREAPQPLKEEYLLSGLLEPTNEPYAIAKIAGIKLCQAYRRQYGVNFIAAMPTNLYGINDNFDLAHSHVLPALLRKFHEAKISGSPRVVVWGTGNPRREFLYIDDLAEACCFLMDHYDDGEIINVGTGGDLTIGQLAEMIAGIVGYRGTIAYDASQPDGTPVKRLNVTKMTRLGWQARISLEEGIARTYQWYLENKQQS